MAVAVGKYWLESCHCFTFGFGLFLQLEIFEFSTAGERQVKTGRQQLKVWDREEILAQELKRLGIQGSDRAVCVWRDGQLLHYRDGRRNRGDFNKILFIVSSHHDVSLANVNDECVLFHSPILNEFP